MQRKYIFFKPKGSLPIFIAIAVLAFIGIIIIVAGIALMSELTGNNSGAPQTNEVGSLNCPPGIDTTAVGQCLDSYMKSVVPSSPLIGYGVTFAQAGKQYNVNPALMVAIGKQESSLGTHGIVLSNPHNYYGMTKVGGGWATYGSWDEAITNHARYLRENYLSQGLGTIEQVGAKYAPTKNATNDPNGLNNNWITGVTANFKAIISKCTALSSGGGGDILSVAQSQLGTKESYDNCDCGDVEKYGGSNAPWCAYFVSWVYKKAGYNIPTIAGAQALYDWFGKNQISFTKESGTPQPGDIIYFNHSHVGIVESLDGSGTLHTIEGNAGNPGSVKREKYPNYKNVNDIEGFGRWKK